MALDTLRLVERIHGHLGWLAAAAVVHPAIVLRRPRRAHLAVALSTIALTSTGAVGAWLYVAYREHLKRGIFVDAPTVGLLFERKEHFAFGAILLSWAGTAAYLAAWRSPPESRPILQRTAYRAFVASAALAILVALLGTYVATFRSF